MLIALVVVPKPPRRQCGVVYTNRNKRLSPFFTPKRHYCVTGNTKFVFLVEIRDCLLKNVDKEHPTSAKFGIPTDV